MTWRAWRHRAACHDSVERSGAGRACQRGKAGPCAGVVLAAWALSLAAQAHAQTTPNTATLMQQANAGNAQAEYSLGIDYDYGKGGLPQDPAKAAYWYEKSAKQGYARAEFNLGDDYAMGEDGLRQDPAKAAYWFEKSAKQGYAPAEFNLGVYYDTGKGGLPRDLAKAAYWYEKSAKQGYARAEFNLGIDYYKGEDGLPQNPDKAGYWFRKAAAQGLKPAIAALQRLQHPPPQVATVTTPPPAPPPAPAAVSTPIADNQQALQNLQRFWTLYFQASNAQVVDFGEPALVQPVSFGAKS